MTFIFVAVLVNFLTRVNEQILMGPSVMQPKITKGYVTDVYEILLLQYFLQTYNNS